MKNPRFRLAGIVAATPFGRARARRFDSRAATRPHAAARSPAVRPASSAARAARPAHLALKAFVIAASLASRGCAAARRA
ncbi:hypothetical protein [Burkholderia savannae]|uniref:hypothetical protein n=1 Tax=Burkholderia savannae TaxID=1637837 RepID=UPI000B1D689B|nr:hypothetical protein [Burkholderia savannae]